MCDYSLHNVASRPAKIGDELVTTRFRGSVTRGFAAVAEPTVAVCLLPGTELAFDQEAECEHPFGRVIPRHRFGKKLARFRKVNVSRPSAHHDALEFPNGRIVLLTRLREGQRVSVLQLPAMPRAASLSAARASAEQARRV